MEVHKIEMGETGLFSPLFLDFLNQEKSLKKFYSRFPEKKNFKAQITEKQRHFSANDRKILQAVLLRQYGKLEVSEAVEANIKSISNNKTFTITTGHQLNIFTGPLYFIYKIVTVINACKELKEVYPDHYFIPVFWMASEDHDFEEISHFNLFGNTYKWASDQKGAVGRFDPTALKSILDEMPGANPIFKKAYLNSATLADAVRLYVNEFFGADGIIVIDGDDPELKSQFSDFIKDELENQSSFEKVESDTKALTALGYKSQISAREINLFYLEDGLRERIIHEDGRYKVLNSDLGFDKHEILQLASEEPSKFSPNVILRPLYQEFVLPNLAYVGGPAEVAYWLQLKSTFDHYQVPFPILLPRNFVLYMDHVAKRKFEKSGLALEDIFKAEPDLVKKHVKESTSNDLELSKEKQEVSELFSNISEKAKQVDKTLEPLVKGETQRALNSIEKIEKKIVKAEQRHHDDLIRQISSLKSVLFPGGGPQERTLNFLNFYLDDPAFLEKIRSSLSPFDLRYHIITDGS